MAGQSQSEVEARIDYLLEKGYLLHDPAHGGLTLSPRRSEERRVGKECRY